MENHFGKGLMAGLQASYADRRACGEFLRRL